MRRSGKIIALVILVAVALSVFAIFNVFAADTSGPKSLFSQAGGGKLEIKNTPATMVFTDKIATNGVAYKTVGYTDGWTVEQGGYTSAPYVQFTPGTHYLKDGYRTYATVAGTDDVDYMVIDLDISTDSNQFDQLYFQTLFYYGNGEGSRTSAQSGHYLLFGDSGEDAYFSLSSSTSTKIPIDVQSGEEWAHITMVVDATADTNRTMYLYYNGRFIHSRVCMRDTATMLESVRISLGTAGTAPDLDNETFSFANLTIKSFPKGYTGELAEEKANLGSERYPLSSFSDLGYCLENLPENTIAEVTHADSTVTNVTKISDLDGNLTAGDTVKLYRDIARKIVVPGKVVDDVVVPDVTFDLNGHSMVAPLALEDYAELDWIIRDGNGNLYSYTDADTSEVVYGKGAQVYTDGALTTDNLYAFASAMFPNGIVGGSVVKFTCLKDTSVKYTAALSHGNSKVTYDLNGKTLSNLSGGKVLFRSTAASSRIVIRDGKMINAASNPVYMDKAVKYYLVDVDLEVNNSFTDIRSGTLFFTDCNITNKNTVAAVKSYGGATSATVLDGCTINSSDIPLFSGNTSISGQRRGSVNTFIGLYDSTAYSTANVISLEYYANEYQSANEVTKSNQNNIALSIQGSSITSDGPAISVGIESLLDKNNSYAFADGFSATTDVYIEGSTFDAECVTSSDDETAMATVNSQNATVGTYTVNTNVTLKRSKLKTDNYAFKNTVGAADNNGATAVKLYDDVKLTTRSWAKESDSPVNVEFDEGVKLAYSYDNDYPYIATLNWTESSLVGDRPDTTTVELNPIFGDGMVIQAHKEINVNGTCKSIGATIEVTIGDKTVTTTVAGDCSWCATFPPMDYAKGLTIYVNEVGLMFPETKVENVDIGEIWMMSGQSNSVYGVYKMEDFEEYRRNADNYDNIRVYAVAQGHSIVERDEVKGSGWYQATAANLSKSDTQSGISAIAYVMATRLAVELGEDVTIGILDINFNGSTVEAWMSEKNLEKVDPVLDAKYKAYNNFYEKNGTYPTEADVSSYGTYVTSGKLYQKMACACYNAMISPIAGFSIRGAIWYQGEGNASSVTATEDGDYTKHFNGVRNTFRETFCDADLPVFIIQIPPRMGNPFYFRALQYKLAHDDANTYVVASHVASSTYTDNELQYTGPTSDSMVHYERKSPVGLALANSVLENVYHAGEGLKISAPKILSIVIEGGAVKITFDRELTVDMGNEMIGFEIAGSGDEWVAAKASYKDCVVTLTADGVSSPEKVRYGAGKSILVFDDGTELLHNKTDASFTHDETAHTVTITANGKTYVINTSDPAIIGARSISNVVATNGSTLPIFLINIKDYANLSGIFVGDGMVDGFDPSVKDYEIWVDVSLGYPEISATPGASGESVTVVPATDENGGVATVTVVSASGNVIEVYKVKVNLVTEFSASAQVVNKNGAKGTVTFVVDDGYTPTATFMKSMMEKYTKLAVTYAIYTKNFLTTSEEYTTDNGLIIDDIDGDGMKEYVLDENGNYTYVRNEETIDFWRDILSVGRSEIVAHSHTHSFWGVNDEGGAQLTAATSGAISTRIYSSLAEGSASKEVYASMQIVRDLFSDTSRALTYVNAGIPPKEGDAPVTEEVQVYLSKQTVRVLYDTNVTVTDGKVYLNDLTWVNLQSTVGTLPANTDVITTADTSSGVIPAGTPIYLASDYVTVPTTDPDGNANVVKGFKAYIKDVYAQAYEDGTIIGARTSGQKVYVASDFTDDENRLFRKAYIIATSTNEARPESWKTHIDNAIAANGGWASFCIHAMTEDIAEEGQGGHKITWEQADDLFKYACDKGDDLWIASQTDATLYYHQWSTSTVNAVYNVNGNKIVVSLTDEERDDVYDMPLTVKVTIPEFWTSANAHGAELEIMEDGDGNRFVYVDVAPETSLDVIGK